MKKKSNFMSKLFSGRVPLLIGLILLTLIITYIVEPGSFNTGNAHQIMNNLCYLMIFGVGVAVLLMGGGFDFACSGHATVSTLIFLLVLQNFEGLPWWIAGICALIFGAFAGGVNAFFAQVLHLMPFIATIAMSNVWGGIAKWATKGNYVAINNEGFSKITTVTIGNTPIPVLFIFVILVVVIYSLILKYSKFGRSIAMVGGNPVAARLAGLNPDRIKSILYINTGVLSAVGGLIWSSQQRMYNPEGMTALSPQMTSLTAAILGGVSFMGGSGTLGGAMVGVLLTTILSYALQAMMLPTWVTTLVNGMLLVIALTIDGLTKRSKGGGEKMLMPGMK